MENLQWIRWEVIENELSYVIMGIYSYKWLYSTTLSKFELEFESQTSKVAKEYTHLEQYNEKNELICVVKLEQARKDVDKTVGKKPMKQNMSEVV